MNRRAVLTLTVSLAAGLALAGCSAESSASTSDSGSAASAASTAPGGIPKLQVTGAFMPQPVGDLAAGFLVVTNKGGGADRLTSVTSDISDNISIHKTENQRMEEVTSFPVPAGGTLDLERGGNHIMFMSIKKQPKKGQTIDVELHFEKSGPVKVELPVKETNYNPATQQ
ncbi:copper chaperone [Streptomyces sp. 150FB]|uniref:copper chaperone PCu(A)C n=1 Tax=Streptomyces sp. 150FB TaxID=1576605 RepID=UPI0005891B1A|nr:copper chaperone PCu(A)C [Streptomyces sp. 150FB]KIF75446.1 copper chaperone [Streptomyces sp. 150FB]